MMYQQNIPEIDRSGITSRYPFQVQSSVVPAMIIPYYASTSGNASSYFTDNNTGNMTSNQQRPIATVVPNLCCSSRNCRDNHVPMNRCNGAAAAATGRSGKTTLEVEIVFNEEYCNSDNSSPVIIDRKLKLKLELPTSSQLTKSSTLKSFNVRLIHPLQQEKQQQQQQQEKQQQQQQYHCYQQEPQQQKLQQQPYHHYDQSHQQYYDDSKSTTAATSVITPISPTSSCGLLSSTATSKKNHLCWNHQHHHPPPRHHQEQQQEYRCYDYDPSSTYQLRPDDAVSSSSLLPSQASTTRKVNGSEEVHGNGEEGAVVENTVATPENVPSSFSFLSSPSPSPSILSLSSSSLDAETTSGTTRNNVNETSGCGRRVVGGVVEAAATTTRGPVINGDTTTPLFLPLLPPLYQDINNHVSLSSSSSSSSSSSLTTLATTSPYSSSMRTSPSNKNKRQRC